MNNPAVILLIYTVFTITYSANKGFYSPIPVVVMVLLLFIMLVLQWPRWQEWTSGLEYDLDLLLKIVLAVMTILSLMDYGGYYVTNHGLFRMAFVLQAMNAAVIILFFCKSTTHGFKGFIIKNRLALYLLLFIAARSVNILATSPPFIDVYYMVTQAAKAMSMGQNPYTFTFDFNEPFGMGIFDHYNYLPVSFLSVMPFLNIFGDIRFGYLIFDLTSFFGIYLLGKKTFTGREPGLTACLTALLLITNPISAFIIEQGWVEPIMVMLLVVFGLFYNAQRKILSAVAIGLLLASKQYMALCLPMFLRFYGWGLRLWTITLACAAAIILPFLFLSPADMVEDVFTFYLQLPARYDSATVASFVHNELPRLENQLHRIMDNSYLTYLIAGSALTILVIYLLWTRSKSLRGFYVSLAVILMAFFLFSKMNFANYDYLIGSLMLMAMVSGDGEQQKRPA